MGSAPHAATRTVAMMIRAIPIAATRKPTYVIEPDRSWFKVDWSELWAYRDLVVLLFRRDQASKYHQTILGPLWYVVHPLATALIFSVVFARFAGISTEGVPRMLFYLSGLLSWNFFAQSLNATSGIFAANAGLFGKVYFPRLVVPAAALMSTGVALVLQFFTFLAFFAIQKQMDPVAEFGMTPMLLLLPLIVLQTAALALGGGLLLSSLTARYRDLMHAVPYLISSLMYVTPVIYPLSQVPPEYVWLVQLNPMTFIVEAFRLGLLGVGSLDPFAAAVSMGVTGVVLASGILLFQRIERRVVDTV